MCQASCVPAYASVREIQKLKFELILQMKDGRGDMVSSS